MADVADVQMEVDTSVEIKDEIKVSYNAELNHPFEIIKRFAGVHVRMKGNELEFYQLVTIVKQLEGWQTSQQDEFVLQFLDHPDVFNANCSDMVRALCNLKWSNFSAEIQVKFVDFLVNIAAFNPIHLNQVLRSAVVNCLNGFPELIEESQVQSDEIKTEEVKIEENPIETQAGKQSDEKLIEQRREEFEVIFQLGLRAIYQLIPNNSVRIPLVSALLEKMKLHKSAPKERFFLYTRLLITLADKYPTVAKELWFCLIDCLLKFDGEVTSEITSQQMSDVRQIFPKRDEHAIDESDLVVNTTRQKLDMCMTMVFCYISLGSEQPRIRPADYLYTKWMEGMELSDEFFAHMFLSLESQVLTVHELENVPFIWFYMCLENRQLLGKLLDQLWQLILTPFKSPNEWKKTHNAVTFMAGLLARGDFVEIEVAYHWLKQMIEWCVNYVNNARQVKYGGGIQHSTFYATVQAAFFLLCFRYKEFNEAKMAEELRLWGIARIVHSQLEPLNFIPRSLSLFFASISRYMQLVYCNHIVNMSSDQVGAETCFPFLRYGLVECAKYFQLHLRVFVPIENDLATINSIRSRRTTEVVADENDFDFMEEDDGIEVDCE